MLYKAPPIVIRWVRLAFMAAALCIVGTAAIIYTATICKTNNRELNDNNNLNIEQKAGYGLYIDDVFIAACNEYTSIKSAIINTANGLADAYGAPNGGHSLVNDVCVINGIYNSSAFVDTNRLSALLGVKDNVVSLSVTTVCGNDAGIELSVKTKVNNYLTETIEKPSVQFGTGLLPSGVEIIVAEGKDGIAKTNYEFSYINGILCEKKQYTSTVIKEPVLQEKWYGTETGATLLSADKMFALPYNGRISSPYGYRRLWGKVELHNGIDFVGLYGGCYGDPIYAAHDGIVSYSGWKGGYGKAIYIDHTQEITSLYAHCSQLLVEEGAYVRKGQLIALIGNTGRVTGAHLHFGILKNGVACNPALYLDWSEFQDLKNRN